MPLNTIILLGIIILVVYFLFSNLEDKSGLQAMVLGIEVTLVGGIMAVDPNTSLGGLEYIFVLIGLILNIIGFKSGDNNAEI